MHGVEVYDQQKFFEVWNLGVGRTLVLEVVHGVGVVLGALGLVAVSGLVVRVLLTVSRVGDVAVVLEYHHY